MTAIGRGSRVEMQIGHIATVLVDRQHRREIQDVAADLLLSAPKLLWPKVWFKVRP